MKYHQPFYPDACYHIFNHAVGNENLFRSEDNYYYFLRKYSHHIYPVVKTIAYNLLPNHFHFLVRVRDEEALVKRCEELIELKNAELEKPYRFGNKPIRLKEKHQQPKKFEREKFSAHDFVMQQFSNLFNGYAKAYNIQYVRKGALFLDYLMRTHVQNDNYVKNLIAYIHYNAGHHNLCRNVEDWKFSSFHSPLSNSKTKTEREEILKLFETKEGYKKYHKDFKDMMDDDLEFL
ncbi:MAG: hypothetical protein ABI723_24900 [Bacteroidia bacterium]